MRLIPANSSNLTGFAYDPDLQDFYVCFQDGRICRYPDTRPWDVTNVVFAKSQGQAFNAFKQGKPFFNVDPNSEVADGLRL